MPSSMRQSVTVTSKKMDEVQTLNTPMTTKQFPKDEIKLKHSKSKDQLPASVNSATSNLSISSVNSKIPTKKLLEQKKVVTSLSTTSQLSSSPLTTNNSTKKNLAPSMSASHLSYSTPQNSTITPPTTKTVRESNYTPSITNIGD